MTNLLNAVECFGKTLEGWNTGVTKGLLITVLVLLSVATVLMFVYVIKLLRATQWETDETPTEQPAKRSKKVKHDTKVTRNTQVIYVQAQDVEEDDAPDEQTAEEPIVEEEPVVEEPIAAEEIDDLQAVASTTPYPELIEEESVQAGRLGYNKSFTAHLIQANDKTKQWYTEIKNELLSYKKVHDRMSWKRETYRCHRQPVARLAFRGKTLCLYLPLEASDYVDKYHAEDVSDKVSYADTPLMLRLKSNRRVKNAKLLIAEVMQRNEIARLPQQPSVDYYVPYEGIVELIEKGLVKRVMRYLKK